MGYFDIQVNGYGGVDFNQDDLGADDLHRACAKLRADGVDGILAAIITDAADRMVARLARLVALREADALARDIIAGIHIEGPFLNPTDGYRGAHPRDAIVAADLDLAARLLDAAGGLTRVFTLAPERDHGARVTRWLADRGVVVSAGHTDATLDQLREGIDAGLRMFTHVGNGCPAHLPRHDNIVQRALYLRDELWLSFIADGIHVPFPALRNYLDLAGPDGRCVVTTDAMAAAGLGPGLFRLARWEVRVGDDLAARAPDGSHLIGSAVSMAQVAQRLRHELQLPESRVRSLTVTAPKAAVGL
jgi:N-acetylglucosamine-6-phosphate deacetylase